MFIFNAGSVKTLFTFIVSKLYKPLVQEKLTVTPSLITAEVYRSIVEFTPPMDDKATASLGAISVDIRSLVKDATYGDTATATLGAVSVEVRNLLRDLTLSEDKVTAQLAVNQVSITDILVEHNNYNDVTNASLQAIEVSIT